MQLSYKTCVAVFGPNGLAAVRHNEWSTTTGKLLNKLEPDKSKRVDSRTFNDALNKVFSSSLVTQF